MENRPESAKEKWLESIRQTREYMQARSREFEADQLRREERALDLEDTNLQLLRTTQMQADQINELQYTNSQLRREKQEQEDRAKGLQSINTRLLHQKHEQEEQTKRLQEANSNHVAQAKEYEDLIYNLEKNREAGDCLFKLYADSVNESRTKLKEMMDALGEESEGLKSENQTLSDKETGYRWLANRSLRP